MNKEYLYLDYNATSPLAQNVKSFLAKGDLLFANPSSVHGLGKQSRKYINETVSYLEKFFKLQDHEIIFNSGATESINTVVKSFLDNHDKEMHFIFSSTDHNAVTECANFLRAKGVSCTEIPYDNTGLIDATELANICESLNDENKKVLVNLTWVNSESGVIQNVNSLANLLSKFKNVFIHVDAVQSIGKIKDFTNLSKNIHFYTYSAHKFGALKGIGFFFVKKNVVLSPLLHGGGQQDGIRSGTENPLGVHSIKLALEELSELLDFDKSQTNQKLFEDKVASILAGKGSIVASDLTRAHNTTAICLANHKADEALIYFDLHGIAVSAGSACSSGSLKKSKAMSVFVGDKLSDHVIRVSRPLFSDENTLINVANQFTQVLADFLNS